MSEKLNISACRFTLGVHKSRYSVSLDVLVGNIMSYMGYLETKGENSIMGKAPTLSKALVENDSNNKLWANCYGKIR